MSEAVPTKPPGTNSARLRPRADNADLAGLLAFWVLTVLVSLLVGGGLSPALRGAAPGLDQWIQRADIVAGVTSQFAAIFTALLLVHMTIQVVRVAGPRPRVLVTALLGAIAVVIVMVAQRARIPYGLAMSGALLTTAVLLTAPWSIRLPVRGSRLLLTLGGMSLGLETLRLHFDRNELAATWSTSLGMLSWLCAMSAAMVALFRQYMISRIGKWALPIILGLGLLAALIERSASSREVSSWIVVLGRVLTELAPRSGGSLPGAASAFVVAIAGLTTAWCVGAQLWGERRESSQLMLATVITLGVAVQTSPLGLATMTLAAIACIVTGASREA